MFKFGARLIQGYRLLLEASIRAIVGIILLGVAALAISVPLWFLATEMPVFFNYLFFAALVAGGSFVFIRKGMKNGTLEHIAFTLNILGVVVFLFLGYTIPAVIAAIILSGFSAWRVSKR